MIEEGAFRPNGPGVEELSENGDEVLEVGGLSGEGNGGSRDCGRVDWGVVLHLPGMHFHGGLGVEETLCSGNWIGDGTDGGILTVGIVEGDRVVGEDGWGNNFCGACRGSWIEIEGVFFEKWVGFWKNFGAEVIEKGG